MRRQLAPIPVAVLGFCGLVLWQACADGDAAPPLEGDRVYVEDARAVPSPGAGGPGGVGVVYLTVANPTGEDDVLRSASTPAAKVAEVHETVQGEGGVVRMEAFPEGLPVPAGERVELAPGGKHLMLMALEGPLTVGKEIELTLRFDRAGELRLTVPVRDRHEEMDF